MPVLQDVQPLRKSFLLALLLTGSEARAEQAVGASIGGLEDCEAWPDRLVEGTAIRAVRMRGEAGGTFEGLPVELQQLMQLPETSRQCFVLRIFADWSREKCAEVLHLDGEQVDQAISDAACELTRLGR